MATTFTDQATALDAGLTASHRTVFGLPVATAGQHLEGLAPSGYVYASASDMARYLTLYLEEGAVDGQQILAADRVDEMLAPATDPRTFPLQGHDFTARYGAGWFVGPFGAADDARWHQGSLPHFSAWTVLLPESDQAVVVLLNSGSQLEVGGANAGWSRIPLGVVDILRDEPPPTGVSSVRFGIVFATLVLVVVLVQVRSLVRTVRRRRPARGRVRRLVLAALQVGLGVLVLVAYPAVTGGLGWGAAFSFVPDLSIAVALVAGLAVVGGLAVVATTVGRGVRPRSGPG
jgi:CubicO group peptidase (beta-lactamase class C family)